MYYRKDSVLDKPENQGFRLEEIRALLEQLEAGGVQLELVETSALSDENLMKAYLEAIVPSVYKKYRIRQVFGSKRHPGCLFGKGVPALVVYERGDHLPTDVYPHEEGGRMVTIREFLESMLQSRAGRSEALQAAARMDELRVRIGPIGFKASELIREGRRR